MLLDSSAIPELHKILSSADTPSLDRIKGAEVSLTTAMSLALLHQNFESKGSTKEASRIRKLGDVSVLEGIKKLNNSSSQESSDPFSSPRFELYRISGRSDLTTPEWPLFYDRFRRTALNGRKGQMYRSVSGALGEMGDNLVSHAYENEVGPFLGLAGFYISDDTASFCVADCGGGFLRSLTRDSRWAALRTENDALNAIVKKHATSRPNETEGGGFRELFRMLLGFNGLLILRSRGCVFHISNQGAVQTIKIRNSEDIEGSFVTVVISEKTQPSERPLRFPS